MKQILIIVAIVLCIGPSYASAHAVPLESTPASSESVALMPETVEIRFSERIDVAASRIRVRDSDGGTVSADNSALLQGDDYTIAVPVTTRSEGVYTVDWSVVSKDDGHFTRGSYLFAVGGSVILDNAASGDVEIVQIKTLPEIFGMTVELFGHGLMWAIVILLAFVLRPLLQKKRLNATSELVSRGFLWFAIAGSFLAISGALFQIVMKSKDLAVLHEGNVAEAIPLYLSTVAGEATLYRIVAAAVFLSLFFIFRRVIVQSVRFTWQEALLFVTLSVFAFFRAKVSHATANHFFPDVSVAINFVHLIEKDVWAGMLAILFVLLLFRRTRELFSAIASRVNALLTWNLAAVSLTGSYIIWLHLRGFENVFSTQWGSSFIELLLIAALLVGIRSYQAIVSCHRPDVFRKFFPITLGAELMLAIMVIYASSSVIITSPPPQEPPMPVYRVTDESAEITLRKNPYQDGTILLQVESPHVLETPAVTLKKEGDSEVDVRISEMYPGSYVLPASLISKDSSYEIRVRVPQEGAYDAVAVFFIPKGVYDSSQYPEGERGFDFFTICMICIALVGCVGASLLYTMSRNVKTQDVPVRGAYPDFYASTSLVVTGLIVGVFISILNASGVQNPYRAQCEADGNMWHVMLPMKAGVPISSMPREGCMWGMGAYQYMFPDRGEYAYLRELPNTSVAVDFSEPPTDGVASTFIVSVKNADGSPANLLVDMEKLIHAVIVSKDQSVFAHIHPDDVRALTQEERDTSTFALSYVFPKAGEYLLSVDYANGVTLNSSQHLVTVTGNTQQEENARTYGSPAKVGAFDVSLSYSQPFAGDVSTLVYTVSVDGEPAVLQPYLSAAMHIAVVKNDLAAFAHTHGEVHEPGVQVPAVQVRDGKIVHSMAAMTTPLQFSYPIDAHVIFPTAGLYTVWAQFQSEGIVYAAPFTVRVEE